MPTKQGTEYWTKVAEQCRQRPMVWHLVLQDKSRSWGHQIRKGAIKALKPVEDWEVRTRQHTKTSADVWVRYLGDHTKGGQGGHPEEE